MAPTEGEEEQPELVDLKAFAHLRCVVESRVRLAVPRHEVEEIANDAIVRATISWMERGFDGPFRVLVLKVADDLCADFRRRAGRQPDVLSLPENLPNCSGKPSRSHRVRATMLRLLSRADGLFTPRQRQVAYLIFSGEARTTSELTRRTGLHGNDLGDTILAVAKKIRLAARNLPGV